MISPNTWKHRWQRTWTWTLNWSPHLPPRPPNMRAGCTIGGGLEVEAEKGWELQEKEIKTQPDEDQVWWSMGDNKTLTVSDGFIFTITSINMDSIKSVCQSYHFSAAEGGEWTGYNWDCHCIVSLWVCYDPGHVFPVTVLLSQCWLVPRYPSTGHWVPVRLLRPPTVALAGRGWLLTLTLTQARGAVTWVDPGLTQWSPSHCYDGTERQLCLWVNVKPKLVNTVIVSTVDLWLQSFSLSLILSLTNPISWHHHDNWQQSEDV